MDAASRNNDVLLASLESKNILIKTMNDVSAEIAKNYIEYRGLQMQLKILNENINAQSEILTLNKELFNRGFFDVTTENEDQKNLDSLLMQQSQVNFSMEKIIFHLSTLLNYLPETLLESLCQPQDLPDLIGDKPIGCPSDIICQNPSVKEARKQYEASRAKQALYNYQKTVLEALENAETALAAFNYETDKLHYLENAKNFKAESHQLTKDLDKRGYKDNRDVLQAYQEFLLNENSVIQGKVDLLISYINLYHALTSSWEACCHCPSKCRTK